MSDTNYRDPTHNNFPNDYDQTNVDTRVLTRTRAVREKMYGIDTREAMAQAEEINSVVANEAKKVANEVEQRQTDLENRYEDQIAGNTDINEVIDARRPLATNPYETLGERLNAMTEQTEDAIRQKNHDDVFKALEGGMHQYLIDFYENNRNEFGNDGSVKINLINDLHAQKSVYPSPLVDHGESAKRAFQYLLLHGLFSKHVDFSIINGDQIHGREPIQLCKDRNQSIKSICNLYDSPVYYNLGNHEDGDCYKVPKTRENLITKQELLDIYGISSFNQSIISEEQKLKILIVSVYDNPEIYVDGVNIHPRDQHSVITNQTFDFVKKELEATPDDYYVLAIMHNVISSNDSDYSVNHYALTRLFTNFNQSTSEHITSNLPYYSIDSTVDFSNHPKNRFIGIIGGHRHKDEYDNSRGWHDITRTCQVCSDPADHTGTPIRVLDTETELITDIVTIDTEEKKLYIKRFGYGESLDLSFGGMTE
ncbi:hypothetical protein GV845_09895 [Enterococcus gallinarum]|uniref:metallophosphoesterase n=1 Tax=Enterococcus gallinarum TaxID=1353 RepID=UPI001378BF03|nr:metallophosphoesterase [Enterococcus gallinarum]NCE16500.1 hypothetical protein [Enterococcus gallinarum]